MSNTKLFILLYFCNDYHSGQWSRGYKLMCKTQKALRRRNLIPIIHSDSLLRQTTLYKELVEKYGDKI